MEHLIDEGHDALQRWNMEELGREFRGIQQAIVRMSPSQLLLV